MYTVFLQIVKYFVPSLISVAKYISSNKPISLKIMKLLSDLISSKYLLPFNNKDTLNGQRNSFDQKRFHVPNCIRLKCLPFLHLT